MAKPFCALVCLFACAGVARAESHDAILRCVRGAAAVQGASPSMQLSLLAHDCRSACPGLRALAGLSPSEKAKAFVDGCCPPEAATALAAGDWPAVSSACGVPAMNEVLASLEWTAFGKMNRWLQTQAASADVTIRAAAARVFATSRKGRSLSLPLAASWKGHYKLAQSKNADEVASWSYVLLDGGKLYAGSQPGVRFDAKAYVAPKFPERELALADLRRTSDAFRVAAQGSAGEPAERQAKSDPAEQACTPPLLVADERVKAAQIVDVVRAYGDCGVALAVAFNGVTAAHLVLLKRHTASDDKPPVKDPEAPSWLAPPKKQRVKLIGSAADVVKLLDGLYATKVRTALVD